MFATTQSEYGTQKLDGLGIDPKDPTTFVFIEGQQSHLKSDAALQIAKHLQRPWSALAWLKIVPKFIRDPIYTLIAKHRYQILGKRQACMIPSPELKERFLE